MVGSTQEDVRGQMSDDGKQQVMTDEERVDL